MSNNLTLALTRIRTIADAHVSIRKVFDAEPWTIGDTAPCAYISEVTFESKHRTLTQWQDTPTATLRVLFDRPALGVDTAETLAMQVQRDLLTSFRADPTLGGTCLNSIAGAGRLGYLDIANVRYRALEIAIALDLAG